MKIKLNLTMRLIIAIAIGIILGKYSPIFVNQIIITAASIFSEFLKFIIPFMILAYVSTGICGLNNNAGKLLITTVILSYVSSLLSGNLAYFAVSRILPKFISNSNLDLINLSQEEIIAPIFNFNIPVIFDVTSALVLSFVLGLALNKLKMRNNRKTIYLNQVLIEFSQVIELVLNKVIVPLLPLYICSTFIKIAADKSLVDVISMFGKIFAIILPLQFIYVFLLFVFVSIYCKKNLISLLKNQIPAYLSAFGTQSSVATVPINIKSAELNGVSKEIRDFVIPICANIHIVGSMITIVSCVLTILFMQNIPIDFSTVTHFIFILAFAMVAAPAIPGGGIMTALPFLNVVNISSTGNIASLLITLYIVQDSFGTAINVAGDNALALIIDRVSNNFKK
jgi:Na+/H+-dicarboxylate symporter